MEYLASGSRPANLGGAQGFEPLTSTAPGWSNEAGRTYRRRANERLSRPHARMLGAREPSIWDTRQCHRPRSFVKMLAEPRQRRDGRWCGRGNSGVPRSIADRSFLLGARGLTQPAAPDPAQPVARWCQRRGPN